MSGDDARSTCPACGSGDLVPGYETGAVPATSTMLMPDAATALAVPMGVVTLAWCEGCGFITNTSFDAGLLNYSVANEDSQACSEVFDSWSRELARRWVDEHGLAGKQVVEIGCGKGDFLLELIEQGVAHGIGIDPAVQPGRHQGASAQPIEWVAEYYGPQHARHVADAVVCRHSLEHIPQVAEFVSLMAATHVDSADVTVLFEVPDVGRVVDEGAFWDIYHEHCSYFTLASLAGLFVRNGFSVEEARADFDDQYLLMTARRAVESGIADAPAGLASVDRHDFEAFTERCDRVRAEWRTRVADAAGDGRVVVWGAGSKAVAFLAALGPSAAHVDYAVDINPRKWGHFIPGTAHPVVGPAATESDPPDLVVVMNPIYLDEIRDELASRGLHPELVALG